MANVKITNTKDDLNGAILENAATEETLKELLAVMKGQTSGAGGSRKSPLDALTKSSKEASASADEFSDSLDDLNSETLKNTKSMKALDVVSRATSSTMNIFNRGMRGVANTSSDAQGQLEQFGGMITNTAGSVGSAMSSVGDAMVGAGKKATGLGIGLEIVGAGLQMFATASGAAFAAMSTVVGMVQGFQQTFKAINATGFVLDSSFEDLTQTAFKADLTLGQLAGVIDRNRNDFSFFAGSVNQGAKRILAMRDAMDQSLVDGFINVGVSLENIPDALSNYMALLGRSGRQMQQSDQQAIAGATELYKQQRLLANLTGKSVEAIQNEAMERTRSTRVQASFNEMVPEARLAYTQAMGVVGMLGENYANAFEAVFAGDVTDPLYRAMMAGAPELTRVFEDVRNQIATGQISEAESQEAMYNALKNGGPVIQAELEGLADILRYSGLDTPLAQLGPDLGLALERIPQIINGSLDELQANLDQQFAGGTDETGKFADPMLQSFRNVEQGALQVQLALQQIATQITNSIGDETTGLFASFAEALKTTTAEIIGIANSISQGTGIESIAGTDTGPSWYDIDWTRTLGMGVTGATIGAAAGGGIGSIPASVILGAAGVIGDIGTQILGNIFGFSDGGIINASPKGQLAMLHGTEAVVPLPDGNSIPVTMQSPPDMSSANISSDMIDGSKSIPELVQINKSLLQQNYGLNEKLERLIRATEESNNISRSMAYARA